MMDIPNDVLQTVSSLSRFEIPSDFHQIYEDRLNKLRVYKRPWPTNTNLSEYRIHGIFPTVPFHVLSQVYLEYEYKRSWDVPSASRVRDLPHGLTFRLSKQLTLMGLKQSQQDHLNPGVYRHLVSFPLGFAREYVYNLFHTRFTLSGQNHALVMAWTDPLTTRGNSVKTYRQIVSMRSLESGSEILFHYVDQGTLSSLLANFMAKIRLPINLYSLQRACSRIHSTQ